MSDGLEKVNATLQELKEETRLISALLSLIDLLESDLKKFRGCRHETVNRKHGFCIDCGGTIEGDEV